LKKKEKGYRQNILPVVTIEVGKEHVGRKIAITISCKFMMLTALMIERKALYDGLTLKIQWVDLGRSIKIWVSDGVKEDIGIGRNKDSLPYFTQNLLRVC